MSEPSPPVEGDDEAAHDEATELQFDQAEMTTPTPGGPSCDACKRPISDAYYEINGKVICTVCQPQIASAFRGGSAVTRVLKATLFGTLAALAGAALYYAIVRATGIHFGLVAVLVGFMVGGAVRKGTGGRGGLFYQFLALFLTYSSIVAFHVPLLIEEGLKRAGQEAEPAAEAPKDPQPNQAKGKVKPDPIFAGKDAQKAAEKGPVPAPGDAAKKNVAKVQDAGPAEVEPAAERPQSAGVFILSLVMLLLLAIGFLYTLPVQVAMSDFILGLIFCFALWEAWKITKGVKLVFNGPFRVNVEKPGIPPGEVVGDGG